MSNQMMRLMRRMEGQHGNAQTRGGLYLPQGAYSPEDEQDRRRDHLAEQVLLEMVAEVCWTDSGDEVKDRESAIEAMRTAAHASLAAAEVIYPELPDVSANAFPGRQDPLPAAAQEGARTVGVDPASGPDRRVAVRYGVDGTITGLEEIRGEG